MARLAVAVVGGIIGSLIPGIGWSIGFLVGNVIGGVLFPPKGPEGPRLQNLDVLSSAYGQFINQGFGTVRVPGNMIWGLPIKETKHKAGKGGMMGGGGGSGTTYTYSWTGAIAVGRGPIIDITRIWADTKLVYDKRGTTSQSAVTKKKSFRFRVYKGTETQLPDPAIEKDVGAANATAHRGMAYVLFDDIQLADFGNRVPSFTFEVCFSGTIAQTVHVPTVISGGALTGGEQNNYIGVDWDRDRFFTIREGSPSGVRKYNMRTMTEVQQQTFASISTPIVCDPDYGVVFMNADGGNSKPILRVDPDGLVTTETFGVSNSNLDNEMTSFVTLGDMDFVRTINLTGLDTYLITCSIFNDVGVLGPGAGANLEYVWGSLNGTGQKVAEDRCRVVGGPPGQGSANAWVLGHASFGPPSADPWTIYQLNVSASAFVGVNEITGENLMVRFPVAGVINPSDINPTWGEFSAVGQYVFDEQDSTLIIGISGGPTGGPYNSYIVKWDKSEDNFGLVWKVEVENILNVTNSHNQSRLRTGKYAYIEGGDLYEIDTIRGIVVKTDLTGIVSENGAQVYDCERDAILTFATVSGTPKPIMVLLSRAANTSYGAGAIIEDFCAQTGLDPATDIDVTGVTDNVRGYLLNQQSTARACIEPLGFAFLFDGVEIDYKIRFIKRGQTVAASLTEDDLVRIDDETGRVIDETRQQELELPISVSIIYLDYEKDYQQNVAKTSRISLPTPAMYSKNESTTTLPMVLVPEEAKRLADRALWSAWTERVQHKYRISWRYIKYDPSDVIQITLSNGVVLRDRLTRGDIGADFSLEWESVSERSVQYTSTIVADGGQGFNPQEPPGLAASRYFLFDMPYVRDQDYAGATSTVIHVSGSNYGGDTWPGMIVSKSNDGSAYTPAATLTSQATWGVITTVVGDTDLPFQFDTVNTITVSMVQGADNLSSCTREEALNGQNWSVILNENTGVVEVVTFTTVTQNLDGTYTLSDLRRGLRGTEVYTGGHSAGEIFVMLDEATFDLIRMGLDELNITRNFLGIAVGDLEEAGIHKTLATTGRDLKPWAPHNVTATISGSDIVIGYDRRTRFGGNMVDGTGDVPLFEATEEYEIDIYNALGTVVLRTLTATSESVTYLAADITTDFGSIPATLNVAVYQISATVDRGFGELINVEVL